MITVHPFLDPLPLLLGFGFWNQDDGPRTLDDRPWWIDHGPWNQDSGRPYISPYVRKLSFSNKEE